MLIPLPHRDTLYQALLERNPDYDGQAYVGVRTTGIFCRLTCPARKPNKENCVFYASVAKCLDAGFRACKRCHPEQPVASAVPAIETLLAAMEEKPNHRWAESDIKRMGFDPSTVRRSFKRHFGMTFLEMSRQRRLREGFDAISNGSPVIDAQLDASFESASAFRASFAQRLGRAPGSFSRHSELKADWIATPLGDMISISSRTHLYLLEFIDRKELYSGIKKLEQSLKQDLGIGKFEPSRQIKQELKAFFAGTSANFQTPLSFVGSDFSKAVWGELMRIPPGVTRSYSEIAKRIGRPTSARAVARANSTNRLALIVPCHRVIGANGSLTGYAGGLWRKQKLIEIERQFLAPS